MLRGIDSACRYVEYIKRANQSQDQQVYEGARQFHDRATADETVTTGDSQQEAPLYK